MIFLWAALQLGYAVFAIFAFVFVIRHSSKWAALQQKQMIEQSKDAWFTRPGQFKGRYMFYVMKIGIVFSAFILLGMGYSILFGPIVLN